MKKIIIFIFLLSFAFVPFAIKAQTAGDEIKDKVEKVQSTATAFNELQSLKTELDKRIRTEVEQAIDAINTEIVTKNPTVDFSKLNAAIVGPQGEMWKQLDTIVQKITPEDLNQIDDLNKIPSSLDNMAVALSKVGEVSVNFSSSKQTIAGMIAMFKESYIQESQKFLSNNGNLMYEDSDDDGVSDYEETYVYKTDPTKAKTVEGELNDGQKIEKGIDPLSLDNRQITIDDVKTTGATTSLFAITKIELSTSTKGTATEEKQSIELTGQALPNSYITIFIFSTPIIVTVKTDTQGVWSYSLDKELEDGNHTAYVAKVDNSGKIVSKSEPIAFVKTAEAATIIPYTPELAASTGGWYKEYMLTVVGIIFFAFLVSALVIVGTKKNSVSVEKK